MNVRVIRWSTTFDAVPFVTVFDLLVAKRKEFSVVMEEERCDDEGKDKHYIILIIMWSERPLARMCSIDFSRDM